MVCKNSDKLVVVKHNDLIKAAYRLTILESRIILACIAQVNSKGTLSHKDKFSIRVEEIAELLETGNSRNEMYANLKSALDRLAERWVYFIDKTDITPMEMKTRWVSAVGYTSEDARINLYFAPHIIPFLSELSSNFTQYKLKYILRFKSSYSIKFYEVLKSSMNSTVELTIDWMRETMVLNDGGYDRVDNLQNRVIKPAIDELNQFTDLTVSYEPVKTGRKITAFKFTFVCLEDKKAKSKTKPKPKFSQDRIDGVLKADLEKYAKPGESYSQAAARIKAEQLMLEKTGKPKTVDVVW